MTQEQMMQDIYHGMQQTMAGVIKLQSDFSAMRTTMEDMQSDISSMQSDISSMKTDIAELQSDMSEVKSDIVSMKQDISGLRSDADEQKENYACLRTDLGDLKADFREIRLEFANMRSEFADMKARLDGFELLMENEIRRDISFIADGHLDLKRKLDKAVKVWQEKEMLLIRVSNLETDVRKIKKKVGMA